MSAGTDQDPSLEVGRKGQGRGLHRLVLMASAGLLALAVGHFAYHYVLVTEVGFRFFSYVGHHD